MWRSHKTESILRIQVGVPIASHLPRRTCCLHESGEPTESRGLQATSDADVSRLGGMGCVPQRLPY
jgi:hypothetical protein